MGQSQPDFQLVLVVENPDLAVHAAEALTTVSGIGWIEMNDCATAAAWLNPRGSFGRGAVKIGCTQWS
jgi:hypothetical protein